MISPFSFFPIQDGAGGNDKATYPVDIAGSGDGTMLANLLQLAKNEYQQAPDNDSRRYALMHIGMLLHTFADTYAHQMFSGYNEICNNMKIAKVIDNNGGIDITSRSNSYVDVILNMYKDAEGKFTDKMFQIGHMLVGHIPDWTHIQFELAFYDWNGNIERTYTRNNTECFTEVALKILDYLCECNNQPQIGGGMRQDLTDKFMRAFKISDISTTGEDESRYMPVLIHAWSAVFGDCHYRYDRSAIFDGIVKAVRSGEEDHEKEQEMFFLL